MASLRFGTRLRPATWIIVAVIIALLLLPLMFLPLGPDSALFLVTARRMLEGAVYYRDLVDVKPPLISSLYALAVIVFGDSQLSMRWLDFALQGATCLLIVRFVGRLRGNDLEAAIAAVVYAALYASLGFSSTMQAESYTALLSLPALMLVAGSRSRTAFALAGLLVLLLSLMKLTLAICLPALLIVPWISEGLSTSERWRRSLWITSGFLVGCAAAGTWLIYSGAWEGFREVGVYLSGYARTRYGDLTRMVVEFWRGAIGYLAIGGTPVVFTAAIAGAAASIRLWKLADIPRAMCRGAVLLFVLLLVSIYIEGKWYPYHFSRVMAFESILAAPAILALWRWLRRPRTRYALLIGILLVPIAAIYGPPLPWGWYAAYPAALRLLSPERYAAYYDRMDDQFPFSEIKQVRSVVRSLRRTNDTVFVASTIGSLVHLATGSLPRYRIYHSAFLNAWFSPGIWRRQTSAFLLRRVPSIVIVQRDDYARDLTGSDSTSEQMIQRLPGVPELLARAYERPYESGRFIVYRRRGD